MAAMLTIVPSLLPSSSAFSGLASAPTCGPPYAFRFTNISVEDDRVVESVLPMIKGKCSWPVCSTWSVSLSAADAAKTVLVTIEPKADRQQMKIMDIVFENTDVLGLNRANKILLLMFILKQLSLTRSGARRAQSKNQS